MKFFLPIVILLGLLGIGSWQVLRYEDRLSYVGPNISPNQFVAASFQEAINPKDLIRRYKRGQLRVLIVPGHDNQFSGASYDGKREADFNIELARYLAEILASDPKLDVVVARDLVTGFYNKELNKSFDQDRDSILGFKVAKKNLMAELVLNGLVEDRSTNNHAFATTEISYRLYGINKWVNDNNIDLVIHIHFNDYPGHKWNTPGKYSGITVYTPDDQYPNGAAGIAIGQSVFRSLNMIRPTSTNPLEIAGVVPDQELIAVGSNASADAAAILIEYGYIYEPEFQSAVSREKIFKAMAEKTYEGLVDYLE